MLERMMSVGCEGTTGKFRPEQLRNMEQWNGVPDDEQMAAAMHTITIVPDNASTVTYVNPLDPGDGVWRQHPDTSWGQVLPAGSPC